MEKAFTVFVLSGLLAACNTTPTPTSERQPSVPTHSTLSNMSKKETALAFVEAVTNQDADKVRALARTDYIQHNPFLPAGLEPFIGLFPVLKENGTKARAVRVIGEGNFVAIHHLWTGAKPFGAEEMVSFDILRFDDDGKIAEHWDAMMPNTPPNASGRTLLDGPVEIRDVDATQANKELIVRFMEDVLYGKNPGKIAGYLHPERYHQHNPAIRDGLEGLQEAFQALIASNDLFQYRKLHQVIGEGNFILTVNEGEWHGKGHVFYDLFRLEQGKIVEHWDVIQEIPTENLANHNGMFAF